MLGVVVAGMAAGDAEAPLSGCLREGAKSYAKVKHVLRRRRGCCTPVRWRGPSRPARATGPLGPTEYWLSDSMLFSARRLDRAAGPRGRAARPRRGAAQLLPGPDCRPFTEDPLSDAPARRQANSIDRRLAPAGRDGARLAQPIDVAQLGVHRPAAPPATPGYRDASRFARRLRDCEPARCAGRPTGARSHRLPTCPGAGSARIAGLTMSDDDTMSCCRGRARPGTGSAPRPTRPRVSRKPTAATCTFT